MRWKQKLLEMDITTTEFHYKDSNTKNKDKNQGKKRLFEDRIQLREGDEPKEESRFGQTVSDATKNKRSKKERCIKYGRKGHFLRNCKTGWRTKTPPLFIPNPTTKPTQKKLRTETRHFRITEISSENKDQLGNE